MILNIRDYRERPHRWEFVDAIIEPTWHDNAALDSDQAIRNKDDLPYDERRGVSLAEAVEWAMERPIGFTLYIYDAARW
jgi:hypothetical protein